MNASRVRRRLAGATAATLMAGVGALAAASPAAAKANLLAVDKVSLVGENVQVDVTYSCDPGESYQLVANALTQRDTHFQARAATLVKPAKLTCDYNSRTLHLTLKNELSAHFAKGDQVKVKVFYLDPDGFDYANEETATVL
ncbi:hypothetical protein BLA24_32745 [Streptomyces cinnamoneus]|uniref:DUF4333 domain-containing protein n=1 Tax=Streptomyces cinnamoneus TaxID=53446 RepID=A0A2G1XAF6_STRCJ|nr:hypothetical protein [Streptomyces cinnamoneus]PHQ48191.1 hypothetical protein BLA24_32745 [Streptomyces cinnamoneus]PPT15817.1 hypothetical protein CYQ11_25795 [Streptomyces cinnamoneus]